MSAAAENRIRAMLQFRAEQLAIVLDEADRSNNGYTGPARALADFPARFQQSCYELAARELAHESEPEWSWL